MKIQVLMAAVGTSAVLALVGCGGSGSGSSGPDGSSSGQAAPVSTQSSGPGPTGPAPAAGKSIDVCAALPAAMASQITGTKLTSAKTTNVENVVYGCEYHGPDLALLQISVDTQDGKGSFDIDIKALKAVNHPPNRISGVGDEAFSEPNPNGNAGAIGAAGFASYGAVFGEVYIKIGGLTYVNADQGKQIVELLHGKL